MADAEDYEHALSGSRDLVDCVLEGADFAGKDLRERDFRRAKLKGADFTGTDLSGANFEDADESFSKFDQAILTDTKFNGALFRISFVASSLTGSRISGLLNGCNFTGANLIGTNFSGARFIEDCIFEDSIIDESTNFEGAQILRPYARLPVFRYFELNRGVLHRRPAGSREGTGLSKDEASAVSAIDEGLRQLESVRIVSDSEAGLPSFGHNQPPEEFQLTEEEKEETILVLKQARNTLLTGEKSSPKLLAALESASKASRLALTWIGGHIDTTIGEFSKAVGRSLGSKTAAIVTATYFSGAMDRIVEAVEKLLGSM